MTDERISVIRDTVAGIQAQCALLLALIGQMQTGGSPHTSEAAVEAFHRRQQGPQHYGEAPKSDPLAERIAQVAAGAKSPLTAPAGAPLQED